jgi:hypothetical protein
MMDKFRIRASSCGKIMSANGSLTQGNKSYLDLWILEQIYNRKKTFTSKYTEKGLIVENESIDFISEQLGLGFLIKNETHYSNQYITGTPDIVTKDFVIDVKNSWDFSTFPLLESEIPNKDYYWQAMCYMELTNTRQYKLIYVLSDTPEHLIEKEAYIYCKNSGFDTLDEDVFDSFKKRMTYNDIDPSLKIKVFDIEYNEEEIKRIIDKVKICKEYINEQLKNI